MEEQQAAAKLVEAEMVYDEVAEAMAEDEDEDDEEYEEGDEIDLASNVHFGLASKSMLNAGEEEETIQSVGG